MTEPKRVLIVDDEPGVRATLAAVLELEGYAVTEALSGAQGVRFCSARPFDLILTDIRMPGMNGVDMLRAVRKYQPSIAVVLMTAFALEELIEQGLTEGAFTLVQKPFRMDHLVRVLARALRAPAVLVVDDDPEVALTTAHVVRSAGLRAEAVHDGPSAEQALAQAEVDVCVVDLVMPDEDGVAVLDRLKRIDPTLSAIAMTGYNVPDRVHDFVSHGGSTCLRKPFPPRALLLAIARLRGEEAIPPSRGAPA